MELQFLRISMAHCRAQMHGNTTVTIIVLNLVALLSLLLSLMVTRKIRNKKSNRNRIQSNFSLRTIRSHHPASCTRPHTTIFGLSAKASLSLSIIPLLINRCASMTSCAIRLPYLYYGNNLFLCNTVLSCTFLWYLFSF